MSITKQGLRKSLVIIISSFLLFFLSYHCVITLTHTQIHFTYSVSSDVEPWSFNQCVGEAVIVPAGCPYQNRKNKVFFLSTQHALTLFIITKLLLLLT